MEHNIYIYITVMALVTYAIRVLPLTLIRREIKNPFIRSFLYYVPYTTLAVMTFPAIVQATQTPAAGALALVIGIATAWHGLSLFHVACCCCIVVFIVEFIMVPEGRQKADSLREISLGYRLFWFTILTYFNLFCRHTKRRLRITALLSTPRSRLRQ